MKTERKKTVRKTNGFTLVEMLAAVAIIGILAAIAIPTYQSHIKKARVATGKAAALKHGQFLTRYYAQNAKFTGAVLPRLGADVTDYYTFALTDITDNTYKLTASPTSTNTVKQFIFLRESGVLKVCDDAAETKNCQ